jgi:hypothetical protein
MLRLTLTDDRGCFMFRRYSHDRRGVVETLTRGNVIHIRPGFGGATRSCASHSKSQKRRAKRGRVA